ncbi:subtilase family protein [Aquimarina sp. MAR_2010_214]|uniref:S8 family serine peptidase n=1 Tax=Aquimarina sp. MAR_2010_214 TaxID=1250026 RepID=UPI000C70EC64|nr:S8 family serine peptidase [Aquimarina sp. MAR_2010_214]PKV48546.1 subtilase family protein [Aquimarina sp. MAR_2010_214]
MLVKISTNARKTLSTYFPNQDYTIASLDSLKRLYPKNTILQDDILRMSNFIKYNFTEQYINNYKLIADQRITKMLNLAYNDRVIIGDNADDITDKNYGNGVINNNLDISTHGTIVSGIIGAKRHNKLGIDGIANTIKIMPICISGFGNEYDKDLALGIRYAVDNGARVINMSIGKELSLQKHWVDEALKYAEQHNVLIVSSAGNRHLKLDGTNEYPTDSTGDGKEVSSNFIHVGATSYAVNENLIASFSNYSKIEVDVFAPGNKIKTLLPNNRYKIDSGTSISSAIVSGLTSLIFSYYPKLSAKEVKNILIKSGISYNIDVEIKQKDGTKIMIPFSELSKSGKIVNAYNALLLAEQISKSKN